MEKINLVTKVITEDKKEISGNKGDLVLIKVKGRDGYRFGKFDGFEYYVEQYNKKNKKSPYISFEGESYNLDFSTIFGIDVINFRKTPYTDDIYSMKRAEEFIFGKEEIIEYLDKKDNGKYKGHADFIRKIKK